MHYVLFATAVEYRGSKGTNKIYLFDKRKQTQSGVNKPYAK